MRQRRALLPLLAIALQAHTIACPVALPPPGSIVHACAADGGCAAGQRCQDGLCVSTALDAATGAEQAPADRPDLDAPGRDQARRDTAVADLASTDQPSHDTRADAASDAGAGADTPATDARTDGAAIVDSGDAASLDSAPLDDAAVPDTALPDTAVPDTALPDTAVPDTAPIDTGCFNPALAFDGVDDLVLVPDSASLRGLTSITVEAWVLPSAADVAAAGPIYLVAQHDVAGQQGFALQLRNGWLEFCLFDGTRDYCAWAAYDDSQRLQADRWYHVAGSYDLSSPSRFLSIFANGLLLRAESQSETTFTWVAYPGGTRLGRAAGAGTGQFSGLIDEVRISNAARYSSDFAPPLLALPADGQTVALWHLDEGAGQVVTDASSTINHGTLGATSADAADDPAWLPTSCLADRLPATAADAGTGTDAATGPSCTVTYGGITGFQLCHENASSCEFAATTNGTCNALCSGLNQTCIDAFDNVSPICDRREWMGDTCATSRSTEICVCTR